MIELRLPPATDRWQNIVSSCTRNLCVWCNLIYPHMHEFWSGRLSAWTSSSAGLSCFNSAATKPHFKYCKFKGLHGDQTCPGDLPENKSTFWRRGYDTLKTSHLLVHSAEVPELSVISHDAYLLMESANRMQAFTWAFLWFRVLEQMWEGWVCCCRQWSLLSHWNTRTWQQ